MYLPTDDSSLSLQVGWDDLCNKVFEVFKNCLCSLPVLQSTDFEKQFIPQTDTSGRGLAVLSQRDNGGIEYPVAYYSRKLLS